MQQMPVPIGLVGWEDGQLQESAIVEPDRWAIQSAEEVCIKLGGGPEVRIKQRPRDTSLEKGIGVGAVLWEGAFVLSLWATMLNREEWAGKRVLELGAGPGMVGIVLAKLLGAQVTLSDLPSVLPIIEENIRANLVEEGSAKAEVYDWLAPADGGPQSWDWDWVVAADCVYFEDLVEPFVQALRTSMGPRSVGLVCLETRRSEVRGKFLQLLGSVFVVEREALGHLPAAYQREHIELYRLRLGCA